MASISKIFFFENVFDHGEHPLGNCHSRIDIVKLNFNLLKWLFDIIGNFAILSTCCCDVNIFAICKMEKTSFYTVYHPIFFELLIYLWMVHNMNLFRRYHHDISFYFIQLFHSKVKNSMDFISRVIICQSCFTWWSKLPIKLIIVILKPYFDFLFAYHFVSLINSLTSYDTSITFLLIRLLAFNKTSCILTIIVAIANLMILTSQICENPRRNLPIVWTFFIIKYWKVILDILNFDWHDIMIFWTYNI